MSYIYEIKSLAETKEVFLYSTLNDAGITKDDILFKAKDAITNNAAQEIISKFAEENITITSAEIISVSAVALPIMRPPAQESVGFRLAVVYTAKIFSNDKIENSPFPVVVLLVAKWVITAITVVLIAYFAIQAIERVITSLTTTTTKITRYDEYGNIIYEEEKEEPNISGIFSVGIILLLLVGVILFFSKGLPRGK